MKMNLYPKLAFEGIRKNKRLYFPYILTGSIMVMMFYILSYLVESSALKQMKGGEVLSETILPLGSVIIAFFSLIFLFYTNSFLIRERNREFGLYNILGMGKRNIGVIMFYENLIVFVLAIISGLISGIALSKFSEVCLLNLLKKEITYDLSIGKQALISTLAVFGIIYLMLLFNSLIKVSISKPLELLQSNKVGEKPPKGNWLFAVVGVICLGVAYYLAVSIEEVLSAFTVFSGAVILVIVATYLLFIAGSVVFCRILQKNKSYYYKPNHFVSVSSMVYRMKRNGAGLASICILLTMVLVMISATASLYIGSEDSIHNRYPHNINISVKIEDAEGFDDENISSILSVVKENGGNYDEITECRTGVIFVYFTDNGIKFDTGNGSVTFENFGVLQIFTLDDYNRMMNTNETLAKDECLIYCKGTEYNEDTFALADGNSYKIKSVLKDFISNDNITGGIVGSMCIVVDDFNAFVEPVLSQTNQFGNQLLELYWECGVDITADSETEIATSKNIEAALRELDTKDQNSIYSYTVSSREENRASFYTIYGSLFFLGIMLSIVFLIAAVMIIYYKQISEGYEDKARFEIMQKVGMTKKDIHKSINSQILTVFFLPLVFAGLHLGFAFPLIWKILQLLNLRNLTLLIIITVVCYLIFGVFYAIVYKLTARAYYNIVSGSRDKREL